MNLFQEGIENTSIEQIQKFANIAKTMEFEVALGFPSGKDSQGCYTYYMCIIPSGEQIPIEARKIDIIDYTSFMDWNKLRVEFADALIDELKKQ